MAEIIFVVGRSGTGKSTSAENLPPEHTFLVNADDKSLPFKGAKIKYQSKLGNYMASQSVPAIRQTLEKLKPLEDAGKIPKKEFFIVDTINHIMTAKVMNDRRIKGYDKWSDLSGDIFDLIVYLKKNLAEEAIVFIFAHEQFSYTDEGTQERRISVQGKQLEKVNLESMSTVVLYTDVQRKDKEVNYYFQTQSDGISTGKSPKGMFEDYLIPNDLTYVVECIRRYQNGEEYITYETFQQKQ